MKMRRHGTDNTVANITCRGLSWKDQSAATPKVGRTRMPIQRLAQAL